MTPLFPVPIRKDGGGLPARPRTVTPPGPQGIAALYGASLGQIPMHLDPLAAVMSGGAVVSIPNKGGAGTAFNATAGGATINRSPDGKVLTLAVAADYLQLANAADLLNTRVFIVANRSTASQPNIMGGPPELNGGSSADIRIFNGTLPDSSPGTQFGLMSSAFPSVPKTGTAPQVLGTLALYELEITPTSMKMWLNGIASVGNAEAGPFPSIRVNQIGRSHNGVRLPTFVGDIGDIVSLIVDGTGNQDTQIATIRTELAGKHGIAMTIPPAPVAYSTDATAVTGIWTGFADDTLRASLVMPDNTPVRLAVSASPDLSSPVYGPEVTPSGGYAVATVPGLARDTPYFYGVRKADTIYTAQVGKFRTLPAPGPRSFRFGFGNCNSGTSSPAFLAQVAANPLFVLHLGDFFYSDIQTNDPALYHASYDSRFTNSMAVMLREVPTIRTWDDHDYGSDGSSEASVGRPAALAVYKQRDPHPPFAFPETTESNIAYSFVVGRIRFIVPDGRSEKQNSVRMWSPVQRDWILAEITAAKNAGQFVCLCFNLPTFGVEFTQSERIVIGNHIAAEGMEGRVFAVCGDAHAVQIDDGSNKQMASVGMARVPTFHAGPFSQGTSVKGGPWSHGAFVETTRQSGYMDITDTGGDTIDLKFTAFKEDGIVMVTYDFQLSMLGYLGGPTYAVSSAQTHVNEGEAVTFTIASNRPNTSVTVNLTGVAAADVVGGNLAPSVALGADGAGSLVVTIVADALTEGPETLTASIAGSPSTVSVIVNDTSQAPPPTGTAPVVIQHAYGPSVSTTAPTPVTLPAPTTAGNLLVLFVMNDKISGDFTPPPGFVAAAQHITGTGVSGGIFTKTAVAGETTFEVTRTNASLAEVFMVETDASSVDAAALGLTNVSTTSRTSSATVTAAANTLALACWHNDSAQTTTAATSTFFGAEWMNLGGAGVTVTYPVVSSTTAPGWIAASRDVVAAGAVTATFAYTGGSSDENMTMLVTLT